MTAKTQPTTAYALAMLARLQTGSAGQGTARILLAIGGVSPAGQVEHDVIYVTQAPPAVVTAIVNAFEFVSLSAEGLRISCRRPDTDDI